MRPITRNLGIFAISVLLLKNPFGHQSRRFYTRPRAIVILADNREHALMGAGLLAALVIVAFGAVGIALNFAGVSLADVLHSL